MTQLLIDKGLQMCQVIFCLSGVIMDIRNWETKSRFHYFIKKYKLLYIFNLLILDTSTFACFLWTIETFRISNYLPEFMLMAPCITYCITINLQTISHIYYQEELSQLFEKLRELETDIGNNNDHKEIIKSDTKLQKLIVNVLKYTCLATVIAFNLCPLTIMTVKYVTTKEVVLRLSYFVVYVIFDPYDIRYWPFVFISLVWAGFVVILFVGVFHGVFYTCSIFIRMHFRLLKIDFEQIIDVKRGNVDIKQFMKRFAELVRRHQLLIDSVALMEIAYNKPTYVNFVTGSILICLCGFNATETNNILSMMPFVLFLVMGLMQIFFLSLCGDMITSSSSQIGDAVCNCPWYMLDAKTAKVLLTVQMRSQAPCKLTALGFVDVSLNSFTRILSTSWSYFALLKTMSSEEHN